MNYLFTLLACSKQEHSSNFMLKMSLLLLKSACFVKWVSPHHEDGVINFDTVKDQRCLDKISIVVMRWATSFSEWPLGGWTRLGIALGPPFHSLSPLALSGCWILFLFFIVIHEFPFNKEHPIIYYSELVWDCLIHVRLPLLHFSSYATQYGNKSTLPETPTHTMLLVCQPG